jgi:exopolyphosphatase/guanosine-5'-triphosphate,3'-diphosphate pyrophosphatase
MIVASIDIGTNTVLLLIAEVSKDNKLTTILNEYRIPRIGKGLLPGEPIAENKVKELFSVLSEYESIIKKNECKQVLVTATNALRIASNNKIISEEIWEQLNWKVNIVSGEDEAYLSYLGAVSDILEEAEALVIDIGGGSTELIFGNNSVIKYKNSFHTGVVSCTERFLKDDPPTLEQLQEFEQHLDNVFRKLSSLNYAPAIAIALAGTSTTLACMNLNIKNYDEELIEGHILKFNEIYNIKDDIRRLSSSELLKSYNLVVKGREDLILAGSIILLKIMDLLEIDKVRVSTKGIRYGAILKEIKVNN